MSNTSRKLPPWLYIFLEDEEKGYITMDSKPKISRYVQMMEKMVLAAVVNAEASSVDESKVLDELLCKLIEGAIIKRKEDILQGITSTTTGVINTYACKIYVLTEFELSGLIRRAVHDRPLPWK